MFIQTRIFLRNTAGHFSFFAVKMITNAIRFWTFLICLIPSTLCTIFVLYHFLSDRTLRQALNNHVIIVLLIISFIDEITLYPWMLYYYQHENEWQRSYALCVLWGFIDWSFYIAHVLFFAWAVVERHILIFHDGWISTPKKRFFVHYLPLIVLIVYWFVFYVVIYFFPPCPNRLRPTSLVCIYPCLYDSYTLSMWDYLAHQIIPVLVITFFSIGLLVRILLKKRQMRRTIHWRKHRKMTVQLLSIASLYFLILLPYTIVYIMRYIYYLSSPLLTQLSIFTVFFSYFIILLFPFVCACSLPPRQVFPALHSIGT